MSLYLYGLCTLLTTGTARNYKLNNEIKMEAKNFRIGNYLKNKGVPTQLDGRSIFDAWSGTEIYEEIPLTKEWVEKLGGNVINKAEDPTYYMMADGRSEPLKFSKTYNRFLWVRSTGHYKVLEHVHELQNLFFALTGKELLLIADRSACS